MNRSAVEGAARLPEPAASGPFEIAARDARSGARRGRLTTAHGVIDTPAFMPVATQGTVKGLTPRQLEEVGARLVLANAYHLSLRPGAEVIDAAGGLHRFMGWEGAILADSGGYQILSLAPLRTVSDDGVAFRSHLDGSRIFLTPEDVVDLQRRLGVDILMPLDECLPSTAGRAEVAAAMRRTTAWAQRSVRRKMLPGRLLFGIVQGGLFADLRREHAAQLAGFDFPGYAVGGLSVGEERGVTRETAAVTAAAVPEDRPRYLMGVGLPQDLLRFVTMGYDLFDCVLPTRNGRNGTCFTWAGRRNLRLARYARDPEPLDTSCDCYACRNFSRAYLRHLLAAGEMLGAELASMHNLHFYLDLMAQARARVAAGDFAAWAAERVRQIEEGEPA
jgi:queuine tRNA-ribosyltransferase